MTRWEAWTRTALQATCAHPLPQARITRALRIEPLVPSSGLVLAPSLFMRVLALLAVLLAQPGLSALALNLRVCVNCDCEDEVEERQASSGAHSDGCADAGQCCGCRWFATPPRSEAHGVFALGDTMRFDDVRGPHPRGARERVVTDDHPREMMRPPNA